MSPVKLYKVRIQLEEYFNKGWIKPITSPYGVSILFCRKKDGTLKMCIDYQALNLQTKPDKHLLPRIDDPLDWMVYAYCLSSIDLHTGYHQVAICPRNEYKTAFHPSIVCLNFLYCNLA